MAYDVELSGHSDEQTAMVVKTFKRHFRRKRIDGVADPSIRKTLNRSLGALAESE
ncbi:MAG: hypothetical protein V6Z86_02345 [Hyphomicrobiales bacterium]